MLGFTRKTDYALVALAVLSQRAGGAEPTSARRLATDAGLPMALLMQLLQDLHRAGLLRSIRGAGGGYILARPVDQISVLDVVEAIEGRVRVALCCDDPQGGQLCASCELIRQCPVTTGIRRLSERITDLLATVSIEDLMAAPHQPLPGVEVSS